MEKNQSARKVQVSFLLGAGFSVPAGYPTASELRDQLLDFDEQNKIKFSESGVLYEDGIIINCVNRKNYVNSYYLAFEFCKDLIHVYKEGKEFDYEEFYDFLTGDGEINSSRYIDLAKKHIQNITTPRYHQLICDVKFVYNQMISFLIKDKNGNQWYRDSTHLGEISYYENFIQLISELINLDIIVNIHTLNHDLFFESLLKRGNIVKISDGFNGYGSNYYGYLDCNGREYSCRLESYTGNYDTKLRLYKLHGSLNYYIYYTKFNSACCIPDRCIKLQYGIGKVYKELYNGELEIVPKSFHSPFLTGKNKVYNEFFYKDLFSKFQENLEQSSILVIIGYSGGDSGINKYLKEYYKGGKCIIVDPVLEGNGDSNGALKGLAKSLNAIPYAQKVDEFQWKDLNISALLDQSQGKKRG
ncbi:MAG: hypothetical protein ACFNYD_04585 [Bacteroides sp.]